MSNYPNIRRVAHVALILLVIAAVLVGISLLLPNLVTPFIAKSAASVASSMAFAGLALAIAFHEKD